MSAFSPIHSAMLRTRYWITQDAVGTHLGRGLDTLSQSEIGSPNLRIPCSICTYSITVTLALAALFFSTATLLAAPPVNSVTIQFADGSAQILTAPATQPSPALLPLSIIQGKGDAPLVVHARLPDNIPFDAKTEFDFGDNSLYSKLPGFNAAHIYDTPGNYTLTVKSNGSVIGAAAITVRPDSRKKIYVSNDADAASDGLTPDAPTTLARALLNLANDTELLLKRGGTYTCDEIHANFSNLLIGAYGTGEPPLIQLKDQFLSTDQASNGVIVQDLAFDDPARAADTSNKDMPTVFNPAGTNLAVRNCQFRNIGNAISCNGAQKALLVQGNSCPIPTGLRSYLVWGAGSDIVILANTASNSTREHIVRTWGWQRLLVAFNNFANTASKSDPDDFSKDCINLQPGDLACIFGNTVRLGSISAGPLPFEPHLTGHVIIDSNFFYDASLILRSGLSNCIVRDNVIRSSGNTVVDLVGDNQIPRTLDRVTLLNNTFINLDQRGNGLRTSVGLRDIILRNNLYIAPNILSNSWGVNPFDLKPELLTGIKEMAGNIWPTNMPTPWGFATPDASKPLLATDTFKNVPLDSSGNPPADITAGAHPTVFPSTQPTTASR